MAEVNLVFKELPLDQPADLVFGDVEVISDYDLTVAATLPQLALAAVIAPLYEVEVAALLPGLTLSADVSYSSNVDRPVVGMVVAPHQVADKLQIGAQDKSQQIANLIEGWETGFTDTIRTGAGAQIRHRDADHNVKSSTQVKHQDATRVATWPLTTTHADALRDRRNSTRTRFQDGTRVGTWLLKTDWQDRYRDRRPTLRSEFQSGAPIRVGRSHSFTSALPHVIARRSRYQQAMRPGAGIETPPVAPPADPCYLPDPHLVFSSVSALNGNLLFICERHDGGVDPPPATVIVPIRSVYVVINNISLRRVVGNVPIPAFNLSLSIDADSWTWGFSAGLPYSAIGDLESGTELEANINGNLYRLLVERMSRDRTFGRDSLSISGRGKNAILSAPYAPVLTFANTEARTAQQLMADVLTFNGIPLGWDIDWRLDDWTVPAGVFNQRGTYIDGLNAIAGAAGAYLQPHPTLQEIRVLLRYPVAPWDWGTVTPDYELPAAVTTREGIEWIEKPEYNRVYVSGQGQGVLARVTREGTAGDLAAPMVVDPLITAAAPGRQRGTAILADTGKQANVSLRLPVLAETGVITPGKFVRYVDGATTRIGIVRSTSVEARSPEVWQSINVETHL